MDFYITSLIKMLMLPPGCFIFFFILGLVLLKRNEKVAKFILWSNTIVFTLLTLPIVVSALMSVLEPYPALNLENLQGANAQAIVVLGSGRKTNVAEYSGADTVHPRTLNRLRYGSVLHTKTGLPILVTGGRFWEDDEPEGVLMARSLKEDFKLETQWIENESRNTAENAIFSWEILKKEEIKTIYLVTHAWHMPRAKRIFERQGFTVIPAPTRFEGLKSGNVRFSDFVPNSDALRVSYYFIHETIGLIWYNIRY